MRKLAHGVVASILSMLIALGGKRNKIILLLPEQAKELNNVSEKSVFMSQFLHGRHFL